MERGSTKHSGRIDDIQQRETDSLVRGSPSEARNREEREMEGPADDEAVPDARLTGDRGMAAGGIASEELEARSELARHLRPGAFPAERDALLQVALEERAPTGVIAMLASLPEDQEFETLQNVWDELGGTREQRPGG